MRSRDGFGSSRKSACAAIRTPGVLMAAQALLRDETNPTRERIREYLSGNYCRCTGYQAIVDAIEAVARARAGRSGR